MKPASAPYGARRSPRWPSRVQRQEQRDDEGSDEADTSGAEGQPRHRRLAALRGDILNTSAIAPASNPRPTGHLPIRPGGRPR